jgi:muramidase (phage lysozyme)
LGIHKRAIGFGAYIGTKVGNFLEKKFDLSGKLNDLLDKFNGNNDAVRKNSTLTPEQHIQNMNKKIKGTGYEMISAYPARFKRKSDGAEFGIDDLPDGVKDEFKGSGVNYFKNKVSEEQKRRTGSPITPSQPIQTPETTGTTGTLTKKDDGYEGRVKRFGDLVSRGESGGDYNIYNKGNTGGQGHEDLSKISISEYLRRSKLSDKDKNKMFAVGKYQIIPATMMEAVKALNLDPNSTKLEPETQEKIFREYLVKGKRPQLNAYLSGKSDDSNAAIMDAAMEWASIGVSEDTTRRDKKTGKETKIKKGESYYKGMGGNKSSISPEEVLASVYGLKPNKSITAGVIDKHSREVASLNSPRTGSTIITPVINSNVTNNRPVPPRNIPKADTLTSDNSFIRATSRDVIHPVYG